MALPVAVPKAILPDPAAEQQIRTDLCDALRALEVRCCAPLRAMCPLRWFCSAKRVGACPGCGWLFLSIRAQVTLRPSPTFIADVQRDVTANFREILVDWLVEVCAKFRCVPESLFLAV
jgi:hypothetical protein